MFKHIIFATILSFKLFAADERASETFDSQVKTVLSVETQFPAVTSGLSFKAPARIHVMAPATNSASVFIGKTGVTSTPSGAVLTELQAGEVDVLPISDRTILYYIAANDNQKLIVIYMPTGH